MPPVAPVPSIQIRKSVTYWEFAMTFRGSGSLRKCHENADVRPDINLPYVKMQLTHGKNGPAE